MATKTLNENINQAINDFKGVKQAIIDKGVEIPSGTPTSEYGTKISEIQSGGSGGLEITDFSYFCYSGARMDVLERFDTSKSTSFKYMFGNCSSLTTIPQLDTSRGTNFSSMFSGCKRLTGIPQLDTTRGTDFSYMFSTCESLTTIPQLYTSKCTNFSYMFSYCSRLTKIPPLDTSKGTNFRNMFYDCKSLTTIPQLDTSKGTNVSYMFNGCSKLETIAITSFTTNSGTFSNCAALKNLTVEGTITVNRYYTLELDDSPLLTVDSLLNVLNALADNTGGTTCRIVLGSTNLAKLTDEQKAIATNKNYTLA